MPSVEAIENAHFDLDDREIARYWTLSEADLLRIDPVAVMPTASDLPFSSVCFAFRGWPPKRRDRVPVPLLRYVGEQLVIQTDDFEAYFHRQPTRSEHLQEIIDLYGFRSYDQQIGKEIRAWMKTKTHQWHTPLGLLLALLEELRRNGSVRTDASEQPAWCCESNG
jgi:hypothetical protein